MKHGDKKIIRELLGTKKKYADVVEILNTQGVTTPLGRTWTKANLSLFATRTLNIRRQAKHKRASKVAAKRAVKRTQVKVQPKNDLVADLLASNMAKRNKLALLERLL